MRGKINTENKPHPKLRSAIIIEKEISCILHKSRYYNITDKEAMKRKRAIEVRGGAKGHGALLFRHLYWKDNEESRIDIIGRMMEYLRRYPKLYIVNRDDYIIAKDVIRNFNDAERKVIQSIVYGRNPYRFQSRKKMKQLKYYCEIDIAKMFDRILSNYRKLYRENMKVLRSNYMLFYKNYVDNKWDVNDIVNDQYLLTLVMNLENYTLLINTITSMRKGLPNLKKGYTWDR